MSGQATADIQDRLKSWPTAAVQERQKIVEDLVSMSLDPKLGSEFGNLLIRLGKDPGFIRNGELKQNLFRELKKKAAEGREFQLNPAAVFSLMKLTDIHAFYQFYLNLVEKENHWLYYADAFKSTISSLNAGELFDASFRLDRLQENQSRVHEPVDGLQAEIYATLEKTSAKSLLRDHSQSMVEALKKRGIAKHMSNFLSGIYAHDSDTMKPWLEKELVSPETQNSLKVVFLHEFVPEKDITARAKELWQKPDLGFGRQSLYYELSGDPTFYSQLFIPFMESGLYTNEEKLELLDNVGFALSLNRRTVVRDILKSDKVPFIVKRKAAKFVSMQNRTEFKFWREFTDGLKDGPLKTLLDESQRRRAPSIENQPFQDAIRDYSRPRSAGEQKVTELLARVKNVLPEISDPKKAIEMWRQNTSIGLQSFHDRLRLAIDLEEAHDFALRGDPRNLEQRALDFEKRLWTSMGVSKVKPSETDACTIACRIVETSGSWLPSPFAERNPKSEFTFGAMSVISLDSMQEYCSSARSGLPLATKRWLGEVSRAEKEARNKPPIIDFKEIGGDATKLSEEALRQIRALWESSGTLWSVDLYGRVFGLMAGKLLSRDKIEPEVGEIVNSLSYMPEQAMNGSQQNLYSASVISIHAEKQPGALTKNLRFIQSKMKDPLAAPYTFGMVEGEWADPHRANASRNVPFYLALYGHAEDRESRKAYLGLIGDSIVNYCHFLPSLLFHYMRGGAHIGSDQIAPYYLLPTLPYVTAGMRLLSKIALDPKVKKELDECKDNIINTIKFLQDQSGTVASMDIHSYPDSPQYVNQFALLTLAPLINSCNKKGLTDDAPPSLGILAHSEDVGADPEQPRSRTH